MPHVEAYEHATVRSIVLLRAVAQVYEFQRLVQKNGKLLCDLLAVGSVARRQRVVVEGDAIYDRDEE